MTVARRQLRFESLDDSVRDAEHLLVVGYEHAGKWDLGQCCGHLTEWVRYPMDGFPPIPLPMRPVLYLLRTFVAPTMSRKAMESGTLPTGSPTLKQSVLPPDEDPVEAVARFRETVARFRAFTGPLHPSPLLGPLDKATAERLHAVHAAHHLSFLVPKA